jgi:hypothetical protein
MVYKDPTGHFRLKLADDKERNMLDYILCEQLISIKKISPATTPNEFMKIAEHNCNRDLDSIKTQTQYTIDELHTITQLKFNISEEPVWTNFFPQFRPLDEHTSKRLFWFSLHTNREKPKLGQPQGVPPPEDVFKRSKRHIIVPDWDTTKNVRSPFRDEWQEYLRSLPPKSCYWKPSMIFKPDASDILPFPYEEWEIFADVPKTLPDFVILLHTIYTLHVEKQYDRSSFPDWMAFHGRKVKLYQMLRKSSLVHRIARNLEFIENRHEQLFQRFLRDRNALRFGSRIQRTIEHIESNLLEKLIVLSPEHDNITESDFQHLNSTQLKQFFQQLMDPEYDPFDRTHTRINTPRTDQEKVDFLRRNKLEVNPEYEIENPDSMETHARRRRAVPLIPLLTAVGGSIAGSATTMLIMQSAMNKGSDSSDAHIQLLKKFATEIAANRIDYQQVYKVINNVVETLQFFEWQIMTNFDGVTALTMGLDLKGLNQNLQAIAQLTILKHSAAMLAAADGRASPYVLPQKDLDQIVNTMQRRKGITLSHNLADVKTTAMIENEQIVFYFEIPILDPKKEFILYTVTPLPMFTENTTLMPNIDSNHIAINNDGDKFTTLSDVQLNACLDKPPRCKSNTAVVPIQSGISCVALSYIRDTQSCPLSPTIAPVLPRFYFFDNTMVYSTPNVTKIYLKCPRAPGSTGPKDDTLTLNGYGVQNLAPECSLTMPDGTTHITPQVPAKATEMEDKLYKELMQMNQPTEDEIRIDDSDHFSKIAIVRNKFRKTEDLEEFTDRFANAYHPAVMTAHTTQIVIIVSSIVTIIIVIYYCRRKCKCCNRRRGTGEITPGTGQTSLGPVMDHWFVVEDEPDTISGIASRPTPVPRPRTRNPLASFYDSFPAWTRGPDYATVRHPPRPVAKEQEPSIIRMEPVDQPAAIRTASLPAKPTAISPQEFERLRNEQYQLNRNQVPTTSL